MDLRAAFEGRARDAVAGAVAGLIAGAVFLWLAHSQNADVEVALLGGLTGDGRAALAHLILAVLLGGVFGFALQHQDSGYAATLTVAVTCGLLLWILGPVTLPPLFEGERPRWEPELVAAEFPSLVGHLVFCATMGVGFHALAPGSRRLWPVVPKPAVPAKAPVRVVILGGGFAGLSVAQRLERLFHTEPSLEITLISQSNYLLFTPMLAEVAGSGLEAAHISAPVRAACRLTRFRNAEVVEVDAADRSVSFRRRGSSSVETAPYDYLVLALGSIPNFYGLPGLEERALTLKTLQDATRLRNLLISSLEVAEAETDAEARASLLTFVVAGGGFAGTELIAELFDLAHGARRFYPGIGAGELRFVLVHSGERILPELSEELGDYACRKLASRGIVFALGKRISGQTATSVLLNDGSEIPTRTLIWTAGNQPHPLLATLPCERNRSGQVLVDFTLQVKGMDRTWAAGDCAEVPDSYHPGRACPPTAQHALREGKVVAENIAATVSGSPAKEFRFRTMGLLVGLGHQSAAAEVYGRRFSGRLAWLMWRAIYLAKLPGFEKKFRVTIDWGIDLLFPRDIVLTPEAETPTLDAAMRPDSPSVEKPQGEVAR